MIFTRNNDGHRHYTAYVIQYMVKFDPLLLLGVPRKLWVIEAMFVPDFGSGKSKGYGAGKIMPGGKNKLEIVGLCNYSPWDSNLSSFVYGTDMQALKLSRNRAYCNELILLLFVRIYRFDVIARAQK